MAAEGTRHAPATATGLRPPHATRCPARQRRCHANSAHRDVASRCYAPSGHFALRRDDHDNSTTGSLFTWPQGSLCRLPFPRGTPRLGRTRGGRSMSRTVRSRPHLPGRRAPWRLGTRRACRGRRTCERPDFPESGSGHHDHPAAPGTPRRAPDGDGVAAEVAEARHLNTPAAAAAPPRVAADGRSGAGTGDVGGLGQQRSLPPLGKRSKVHLLRGDPRDAREFDWGQLVFPGPLARRSVNRGRCATLPARA